MNKYIPEVICGSPDKPLVIDDIEISCYVLEDETRVLTQMAVIKALGISHGRTRGESDRLVSFTTQERIKSFLENEIVNRIKNPIRFRSPTGGKVTYGYDATILADICFAVIEADGKGKLQKQQKHIAERCRILTKAWSKVGITALVDEATGYQDLRTRDALAKILEKYLLEEYKPWTKTFPDEFYKEMFRLKNWPLYDPKALKRPSILGRYTNDIVYERLAPGVLDELRKRNPVDERGHRKVKHHQWLTGNIGHPKLREHIAGVMALMRASGNWGQFYRLLQRSYIKLNDQIPIALED